MKMNEQEFHAAVMNQLDTCRAGVDKVFFTKYANGELTEEALRDYYGVVYHECQYFVRCLSLIHAKAERKDAREIIAQNLCEEYAKWRDVQQPSGPHAALQRKSWIGPRSYRSQSEPGNLQRVVCDRLGHVPGVLSRGTIHALLS